MLVSDPLSMQAAALPGMSKMQSFTSIAFCLLLSGFIVACSDADSAEKPMPPMDKDSGQTASGTSAKSLEINTNIASAVSGLTAAPARAELRYVKITIDRTLEGGVVSQVGESVGPALAQVVKRPLVWWINPRTDLRKNDVLELVYAQQNEGEPVVHAIWFTSQKLGKTMTAIWFNAKLNEFYRWFQPDGSELALRLVNGPIRRYEQITSLLKDGRGHKGMDFKAPVGSKVYAPFSGKIVRKNWSRRANGLSLDIERPNGTRIYLLHLDRIVRQIKVGSWVKTGQHIAFSGNTGRSTAPHLHYQIEKERRGRVLDPLKMHKSTRFRLQADEVKRMHHRLSRLERLRSRSIR